MSHTEAFILAILYFFGGICSLGIYWYSQRKKRRAEGTVTPFVASIEGLIMAICFWPLFIILHSWQRRVDARNQAPRTLSAQQNGSTQPGDGALDSSRTPPARDR
jgi:hypothetical protein